MYINIVITTNLIYIILTLSSLRSSPLSFVVVFRVGDEVLKEEKEGEVAVGLEIDFLEPSFDYLRE